MNIHPIFDKILPRSGREAHLNQRSCALWFTGLSGSGKSTIAVALEHLLFAEGFFAQILDGDNIRSGINANLGFSPEDRYENIRRIAEVSKLYVQSGVITLNCFVSPTIEIREMARTIIGPEDFVEVFVNTPLHVCESRDVKGLYAKARRGEITQFTGIDAPYEPPVEPDVELLTENTSVGESVAEIMAYLRPRIELT